MAVASGVHDVVLVIGVEKMRDKSAEEGSARRAPRRPPDLHPGRDRTGAVRAVRDPPHARVRHDARDARVRRGEEPLQRRPRSVRALPERDHGRRRAEERAGVPPAPPARLLPADRRRRRDAARQRGAGEASSPTTRCTSPASASPPTIPYLHEKGTFTGLKATTMAAERAYSMAGVEPGPDRHAPRCTTASRSPRSSTSRTSASSTRARAASPRSRARRRSPAASRSTPRAGCSPRAIPIGATGVAQITECWWQLRGEAGERQVEMRNGYALQHNVGGRGSGVSVDQHPHQPP